MLKKYYFRLAWSSAGKGLFGHPATKSILVFTPLKIYNLFKMYGLLLCPNKLLSEINKFLYVSRELTTCPRQNPVYYNFNK